MSQAEMPETRKDEPEQKPGTGIDRTLIHKLLAMPPEERLRSAAAEANNLEFLFARMRRSR